jgi:hypothetical protein
VAAAIRLAAASPSARHASPPSRSRARSPERSASAADRSPALGELHAGASDALRGAPVQEHPVADGAREAHRPGTERRDPDRRRARGDEGEPERLALGRRGRLAREGVAEHRDGCPEPSRAPRTAGPVPIPRIDLPFERSCTVAPACASSCGERAGEEGRRCRASRPSSPAMVSAASVARADLRHEHRPVPEGLTSRRGRTGAPRIRVAERNAVPVIRGRARHMLGW